MRVVVSSDYVRREQNYLVKEYRDVSSHERCATRRLYSAKIMFFG